jgi:hypothetical protein
MLVVERASSSSPPAMATCPPSTICPTIHLHLRGPGHSQQMGVLSDILNVNVGHQEDSVFNYAGPTDRCANNNGPTPQAATRIRRKTSARSNRFGEADIHTDGAGARRSTRWRTYEAHERACRPGTAQGRQDQDQDQPQERLRSHQRRPCGHRGLGRFRSVVCRAGGSAAEGFQA